MRSKALLITNILSSLWSIGLLSFIISFLTKGGMEALTVANNFSYAVSEFADTTYIMIIDIILGLLATHNIIFIIASVLGWLGFSLKKIGCTKAAAILYLIASIIFPVFIILLLPIIILGFVGHSNQKKLLSNN